jgi:glycerol-3-phosphate dehydrogenase
VSGGKLTTFRLIALDALKAAHERLPEPQPFSHNRVFSQPTMSAEELVPSNHVWAQRLLGRYGSLAKNLLDEASPTEHQRIGATDFCLAECRWALRHESVLHLDDLLLRRTRLGMVLQYAGAELFPALEKMCMTELGWSKKQWRDELARYQTIWQRFYSLPKK